MMLQRGDHQVLHEPFSHVADFGLTEIGETLARDEAEVVAAIRALARSGPVFFKDTTDFHYAVMLLDVDFLVDVRHAIVIRRPAEILASYFALAPDLRCEDVGVDRLCEIYDAVVSSGGRAPLIIDSEDLVSRPDPTVRAYCEAVGIPFLPSALTWQSGMLPQWERTSRWHEATSHTTGFVAAPSAYRQTIENNAVLAQFRDHHQPYYDRLHALRVMVGR